jgi:hypothetical protein
MHILVVDVAHIVKLEKYVTFLPPGLGINFGPRKMRVVSCSQANVVATIVVIFMLQQKASIPSVVVGRSVGLQQTC